MLRDKRVNIDMHSYLTYNAYMKQYTIRNIPDHVDRAARGKAKKTYKSLNSVLIDALERGLSVHEEKPLHNDMDDLAGTWVEDPEIDSVLSEFAHIDEELWK